MGKKKHNKNKNSNNNNNNNNTNGSSKNNNVSNATSNDNNNSNTNSSSSRYDKHNLPFVSICTPTYNRRPFIPYMIKCFEHQDYPKDKMEWIIIDDGTDKIKDLVCDISQVKYYAYEEKMSLGKKRNLMHKKSKGDIIVYMDDDDYYPVQRVSHAVNMLITHPSALCAGSSEIYIYFKHIDQMYQFGPYGPNHATAGTFAFKRELLKDHKYDDHAALAEEKAFLKNYTVPFVQLEPKKTILVFSHIHNTFDKKKLLQNGENQFQKRSPRTVDEFVKEPEMKEFYMNTIETLLLDYKPGDPSMKPDVLKQIKEIEEERKKMAMEQQQQQMQQQQQQNGGGKIVINQNGQNIELNNQQIVQIMQKQQEQLQQFSKMLQEKDVLINKLQTDLQNHQNMGAQMNQLMEALNKQKLNAEQKDDPENVKLEIVEKEKEAQPEQST